MNNDVCNQEQLSAFETVLRERRSVRGFLEKEVPDALLQKVFSMAAQTPSNCNTQPWMVHVASGEKAALIKQGLLDAMSKGEFSMDYPYLGQYTGVYKERQYDAAKQLYSAMSIAREDKAARHAAFLRNFEFFGAPHAAFMFIRDGDLREAADLGMYAQSLMLSLQAHGLASCPQTALSFHCDLVRDVLGVPEDQKLLFGLSFGFEDEADAANQCRVAKADLSEHTFFHR